MPDHPAQRPQAAATLSAAECAFRTGLTTRALRIYERRGLISPPRTARGWRRYGERELTRLNSIALLKLAGFTLTKIHSVLVAGHEPRLEQLLRAQLQDWQTRQVQAETGQRVVCAALQRLQGAERLSLDELCALVRSALIESSSAAQQLTQHIRAHYQQRPVRLWLAVPSDEQTQALEAYQDAVQATIDPQLERLQQQGAEPWDAAVQTVMRQHQRLLARHRVREITVQRLTSPPESNEDPMLTDLQQRVRADALRKLKQRPTDDTDLVASHWTRNPFLLGFFARAELHSEPCREIDELLVQCKALIQLQPNPTTREARLLARQLRRLCRRHQLDAPLMFARWAALVRPAPPDMSDAEDKACWVFLISALHCLR